MKREKISSKKQLRADLLLRSALTIYKPNYKLSAEEWRTILDRERAYKKSKEQLVRNANAELGFSFQHQIGISDSFRLADITIPEGSNKQTCCIPIDQAIADHLLKARKIFLKEDKKSFTHNEKQYNESQQYYIADTKYGKVLFLYLEKEKTEKDGKQHYSISLYAILNGKAFFELFRYDTKPNTHYQRFKDGRPTQEKIPIQSEHMHVYNERFAVIYPNSFCHYDVEVLPVNLPDIKEQSKFIKNMYNLEQNLEMGKLPLPTNLSRITNEENVAKFLDTYKKIEQKKIKKNKKTLEK